MSEELGYERMGNVPKKRKSRGAKLDIFPLGLFMKRLHWSVQSI
jgi:hypothetical protein